MDRSPFFALRKFVAPEFVSGTSASELVGQYARNLGARRVLLVTDPGVMEAGWADMAEARLAEAGLSVVVFSGVSQNPRADEVMEGAGIYAGEECDAIVAVGGGSPMDLAKGVGVVTANGRHILEFEGVDLIDVPGPPLICVPTTSGSAADVSQFAIINAPERHLKIAIVSKALVPDAALIDPVVMTTMGPALTAATGFDALTHAMEAYVSNASSPITDLLALSAIRHISAALPAVVRAPQDLGLRARMNQGCLEAGLAFSNAILGAVHAMAHSLGGYRDLPHGECNAILLPHVVDYNYEAVPERYARIGEAMGLSTASLSAASGKRALLDALVELKRSIGLDRSLAELGITRQDIPELAAKAMDDACMVTNPRQPHLKDIEAIYERAL